VTSTERLRVLLVAEQAAGVRVLRLLAAGGHAIAAVATTLDTAADGTTVRHAAERLDAPLIDARLVRDPAFGDWISREGVDVLLNVNSLHIAAADVIAAPRLGSFNLHPGPLPAYAGLNAPSWAIYHGEADHAVSLHWMTRDVDAGAVAYSASFAIDPEETGLTLTLRCVEHGLPLVSRLLEDAVHQPTRIPSEEQAPAGGRFFGADVPQGGALDWNAPARHVLAFVRACDYVPFPSPWGHPRVVDDDGRVVEVVKACATGERSEEAPGTVVRAMPDGGVVVAAADERVVVEQVRVGDEYGAAARLLEPGSLLRPAPARAARA
jgi:UDP-4-amino-4-deoxy-L-arabinose formyltransferase/UDP-glucuronic acid dehydrogenase (UDP-4-keto-hexauronic acid decarboxylating)